MFILIPQKKKKEFQCFINSLTSKIFLYSAGEPNSANVEAHNVGSLCLKTSAIFLKLYLSLPVLRVCFFKENSLYHRLIVTCVSSTAVAVLGETDFRKCLLNWGLKSK